MEPMTVGTPNASFNTSAFESTTNVSSTQFLPSFLLGNDITTSPTTSLSSRITSPTNYVFKSQFSPVQSSSHDKSKFSNNKSMNITEKADGPPLVSLCDYSLINSTNQTAGIDIHGALDATRHDFIEEDAFDNWVTVFGFSSCHMDLVISYFERFGQIVDKKYSSNSGNWIYLKYSNRREAQTAVSHNGKLISSNLMIGVVSRKEKHNLESSRRSDVLQYSCDFPCKQGSNPTPFSPTIRRLTTNCDENTVLLPRNNIPTKSSGVLSKTMEYLFGW